MFQHVLCGSRVTAADPDILFRHQVCAYTYHFCLCDYTYLCDMCAYTYLFDLCAYAYIFYPGVKRYAKIQSCVFLLLRVEAERQNKNLFYCSTPGQKQKGKIYSRVEEIGQNKTLAYCCNPGQKQIDRTRLIQLYSKEKPQGKIRLRYPCTPESERKDTGKLKGNSSHHARSRNAKQTLMCPYTLGRIDNTKSEKKSFFLGRRENTTKC